MEGLSSFLHMQGTSPGQALRAYTMLVEAGFKEKVGLSVYNRLISSAGQAGKLNKAFEVRDTLPVHLVFFFQSGNCSRLSPQRASI